MIIGQVVVMILVLQVVIQIVTKRVTLCAFQESTSKIPGRSGDAVLAVFARRGSAPIVGRQNSHGWFNSHPFMGVQTILSKESTTRMPHQIHSISTCFHLKHTTIIIIGELFNVAFIVFERTGWMIVVNSPSIIVGNKLLTTQQQLPSIALLPWQFPPPLQQWQAQFQCLLQCC